MRLWTRLISLAAILFCGAAQAELVTVTFEPPSLPNGSKHITEWTQAGYKFSTPIGMGHTSTVDALFPYNGTAYLSFLQGDQPLLIRSTTGVNFALLSVDLAEYSTVFPVPKDITFVGTKLDGSTVTQTFTLDGQIGGRDSWQTFTFSNTFRNLAKVEVNTDIYSLDNVRLESGTFPVQNERPIVTVSKDQTLAGPGSAGLFASIKDDGLPAGNTLSIEWSKVSGPGSVTFSPKTKAGTVAQFTSPGTYVLRCTASDGDLAQANEVTVTVGNAVSAGALVTFDALQPNTIYKQWTEAGMTFFLNDTGLLANVPGVYNFMAYNGTSNFSPHIHSGADIYFRQSENKKFALRAIDLAEDGSTFGQPKFLRVVGVKDNGSRVQRDITTDSVFDGAGPLIDFETFNFGPEFEDLEQVTIEGLGYAFDNVRVETKPAPIVFNQAPVVDAGADAEVATLVWPAQFPLTPQSIVDDGLPTGNQVSASWSAVSGPGEIVFRDPAGTSVIAEFPQPGTYVVRCTASDGELSSSDDRTIVVRYDNAAPAIQLGTTAEVQLPAKLSLHAIVTDPTIPIGGGLSQSWSKVSGPANVTFSAATAPDTEVTFTQPGRYVLALTATDGELSTTKEIQVAVSRLPQKGRYRGLLSLGGQASGVLQVKITQSGKVTATLTIGNKTIRFSPTLNLDGSWQGDVGQGSAKYTVAIQFDNANSRLNVTAKKGDASYSAKLVLTGLPKEGIPNARFGGSHTFLLKTRGSAASNPRGHGFGTLTVYSSGAVAIAGRTPDGKAFTAASLLAPDSTCDMFVSQPRAKATLAGTVRFENDAEALTDLSAQMTWIIRGTNAETASLDLTGSRFRLYNSSLEPWTGSAGRVAAVLNVGGSGRTTLTQRVTLLPGGRIEVAAPGNMELRMRLYNTGFFSGSFRTFGTGTQTAFIGVLLQRTKLGGGLLFQSQVPGWVELKPETTTTNSQNPPGGSAGGQ
ncbi:PKD domain-containing protein [Verrucomicrobiota bacterium sgz303538]